jgi:FlaA1/EpsC-like NDP-sugar epimerase
VTGAAGSIGSELVRQLVLLQPERVIALDSNETGLFHVANEVNRLTGASPVETEPASVQVSDEMHRVFERFQPDVVFHAAAYKHVPMLEQHPDQGVIVNIGGTLNVCKAARHYGCERLVFVSTDKAVQPINVLGYTKRIGELLTRAYQDGSGSAFCAVRFGNVIGSRGSALPEFLRQIGEGGPVTVTDPNAERYFMSVRAAVDLLIQAGGSADLGDLFMLDMGEPVSINDAVHRLIRMSGLRVGTDISIEYTGLRPGEKLSEMLVFPSEVVTATDNPRILRIEDRACFDRNELKAEVSCLLDHVYERSHAELKITLRRLTDQFGGREEFSASAAV